MSTLKILAAVSLLLCALLVSAAERINLNAASAATLASGIDGIGPSKAAAIVTYREQHGPFKTVDDLLLVKGIGESTVNKNRDRLTAASP